ncbi:putative ABC transport system permease protein [Paenibacillus rhizosphaerae]|uniref:Putative ABC transport system permease protein n=1 Tax=Paenibacillus rhizosphaerae TaxID=297318 RepID=A0A839TP77_9BACL|nr:ABC transporter permease [Paenibacillus rhizosphaerae]MBB3128313.1 putative ABC transport system permease protein [Paenibacillus rhizosphaerae]
MNKKLFRRLAVTNLKKNAMMILPYLITCVIVVSLFYIVTSLSANSGLNTMSGGNLVIDLMKFGNRLFAILSLLFLLYANSFIMKRRKKEFGLYHILGLEKKHIRQVILLESVICSFVTIACGLIIGVGSNKFVTAALSKIIGTELSFTGFVSVGAAAQTIITFTVIFSLIFLYDIRQIQTTNPAELLKGGQIGEKEPKAKWLLAVLGLGLLLYGYTLSLSVNDPEKDIKTVVGAIVCVTIATYLLFIAGSIAGLKLLRSHENFYYKPKNFTLISGMLYRMKQNAVGLSNICILFTATLFVMTTTVSLYFGISHSVANQFSRDISLSAPASDKEKLSELVKFIEKNKKLHSLQTVNVQQYTGGKFEDDLNEDSKSDNFFLMPLESYNRLTSQSLSLAKDEVLVFSGSAAIHSDTLSFALNKVKVNVKEYLRQFPLSNDYSGIYGLERLYIVSPEDGLLAGYFGTDGASDLYYEFDLAGSESDKSDFSYTISKMAEGFGLTVNSRFTFRDSLNVRFGGLLFLGILISMILFTKTALSIFYKQISEGYDDQERFKILEKVGMSQKEIRSTIRRQILIVFFSPILIATLHLCFALPMVMKLLKIAFMDDGVLIVTSSAVSAAALLIIYGAVFLLTERVYRKIAAPLTTSIGRITG